MNAEDARQATKETLIEKFDLNVPLCRIYAEIRDRSENKGNYTVYIDSKITTIEVDKTRTPNAILALMNILRQDGFRVDYLGDGADATDNNDFIVDWNKGQLFYE